LCPLEWRIIAIELADERLRVGAARDVRVNPIDGAALRDAIGGNHAKPFKPVLKHRSPKAIIADGCLLG
jgi:hypothetical protein